MLIGDMFRFQRSNKSITGEIGVEVELEGRNLDHRYNGWQTVGDGSLRNGREFVMMKPLDLRGTRLALTRLFRNLESDGAEIVPSVRAGIHVHINVRDMTPLQLFNFITLAVVFEQLFAKYCGSSREGNLFCLRSTDAPYFHKLLSDVATTGNFYLFDTDDIRYSFINPKSVPIHGSLEFRALKSTTDVKYIMRWVKALVRLKKSSAMFQYPTDIIEGFSGEEPGRFAEIILGSSLQPFAHPDLIPLLGEGMRSAQDLAYCRPQGWEDFGVGPKGNPFEKLDLINKFPTTEPEAIKYLDPKTLKERGSRFAPYTMSNRSLIEEHLAARVADDIAIAQREARRRGLHHVDN